MTHTADRDVLGHRLPDTVRADFPILAQHPGAYLDNAATAHKPRAVLDAITGYYTTTNSNVGRGYHELGRRSTDVFEQAREAVRAALGARHADEVVFTAGTTDSVNAVADGLGRRLLGPGDAVLVSGMEHNSNLLPWRRLAEETDARLLVAPVDEHGRVDVAGFADLLGPRVRLVAVSHVSNVLGTVNPVAELIAAAHRHGALVVVDGAQAVPHRPVDVRALDADFYCFSAHKVYGPMGVGVLYGKRELLAELRPPRVGGGTVKGVSATEPVRYVPVPARLEAGTPNVAGAVGLAAALAYVDGLGWDAVRDHDQHLVRYAVRRLSERPGVRVIGAPERTPSGIVSFVVDGIHPYDVGGHLDERGIAVRCGVHCASTFLDSLGLVGTVRASFAVYTTPSDVDALVAALDSVRPGFWTTEHPTTRFL
ncbi:aminotransferase class V-fold PLP-dependent enzyme [Goodfellowiella coeruleoviolacea]|uniref:cysteine desulfurase n=1 Tax=Goodfellowiella coeruleoviolacea TaxID=334858 RepID=A0AAE3GHX7_9PSEU|nr:cysteine desulfurase [Goodfellowiella coeruleoviolacea]MCP2167730.1 cysteine desulfurase / selenocysteine lyase [Goodfellowiella coeruleoviolacea]